MSKKGKLRRDREKMRHRVSLRDEEADQFFRLIAGEEVADATEKARLLAAGIKAQVDEERVKKTTGVADVVVGLDDLMG